MWILFCYVLVGVIWWILCGLLKIREVKIEFVWIIRMLRGEEIENYLIVLK